MPAPSTDPSLAGHHRQIDGLRVFAMLGVFYVHFWNPAPLIEHARVSLFFVVSGFLITTMLLRARGSSTPLRVARNFYIRRGLRLLPPLLLALGLADVFNMADVRHSMLWHLFQLTNVYAYLTQSWDPWVTAHLWSLNTLEQFYLFAPLAMLLLTRTQAISAALLLLVASVLIRVHRADLGLNDWIGMPVSYDPVAGGALLALLMPVTALQDALRSRTALATAALVIGAPLALGAHFGTSETYRLLLIPALVCLVSAAWHGFGGPLGWLLGHPALAFLSKISYGAYIYHFPLWWLIGERYPALFTTGPRTFLVMSAASLLLATLSWYGLERHCAALKRHFPTRQPPPPPIPLHPKITAEQTAA